MRTRRIVSIILMLLLTITIVVAITYLVYINRYAGEGRVIEVEKKIVETINSVDLQTFGNLMILQGDKEQLFIEGPENLISDMKVEVINNKLIIKNADKQNWPRFVYGSINYYLTVTDISNVFLSGSGTIRSNEIHVDELTVGNNGSGNINMVLSVNKANVNLNGSGEIKFTGDTKVQEIKISGSGKYDGYDFSTKQTNILSTGSGDSYLYNADSLNVELRGSGNIYYKEGSILQVVDTGSGKLIKVD